VLGDASKPKFRLARCEADERGQLAIGAPDQIHDALDNRGVRNRFGLRPAHEPDGSPSPIEIAENSDRFGVLAGVTALNLHLHLPHFEPVNEGADKYDVLAQQHIDLSAPPHPFVAAGNDRFNAILQAKPGVFHGQLVVCDVTIWASVFGGLENLEQLWQNVVKRPRSGP